MCAGGIVVWGDCLFPPTLQVSLVSSLTVRQVGLLSLMIRMPYKRRFEKS